MFLRISIQDASIQLDTSQQKQQGATCSFFVRTLFVRTGSLRFNKKIRTSHEHFQAGTCNFHRIRLVRLKRQHLVTFPFSCLHVFTNFQVFDRNLYIQINTLENQKLVKSKFLPSTICLLFFSRGFYRKHKICL